MGQGIQSVDHDEANMTQEIMDFRTSMRLKKIIKIKIKWKSTVIQQAFNMARNICMRQSGTSKTQRRRPINLVEIKD